VVEVVEVMVEVVVEVVVPWWLKSCCAVAICGKSKGTVHAIVREMYCGRGI
jgi:hypothetical protein